MEIEQNLLLIDNMNFFLNLKYGIKIFHNVLNDNERIKLLSISKEFLHKISDIHPGLQTTNNFHFILDKRGYFNIILKLLKKSNNKTLKSCWVNYTDKNIKYTNWHIHPDCKSTLLYFIENPESVGTIFKVNEKQFQIKVPTNSLIIFPPTILHTVPHNIKKPRYSLAIDLL